MQNPSNKDTDPALNSTTRKPGRKFKVWMGALIWFTALVLTLSSAVYQRKTGPTHPLRGTFTEGDREFHYKMQRNPTTDAPLQVSVPLPEKCSAVLIWREFPTDWEWKQIRMAEMDAFASATIPVQPVAGKVEYFIEIHRPDQSVFSVPASGNPVIARYKNPVPAWALIPHICLMFAAMLLSNRLGLGIVCREAVRPELIVATVITLTLGGLVFGPIVQQYAFGAAWTGWPLGTDLTDNKLAVNVLIWLVPLASLRKQKFCRYATLLAAVVTLFIYLIPHSLLGSEYDYREVDQSITHELSIGDMSSGLAACFNNERYVDSASFRVNISSKNRSSAS